MSLDFTDDKSTLIQVMAWCRQATSHYMSQCWLRSLSPYGVTRPQWIKHYILKLLLLPEANELIAKERYTMQKFRASWADIYICFSCSMSSEVVEAADIRQTSEGKNAAKIRCQRCPSLVLSPQSANYVQKEVRQSLMFFIPSTSTKLKGGILVSPCPSVHPSVCG